MEIGSYKRDPQNFLAELDKVDLNQLRGADATVLAELLAWLKEHNIKITAKYDPDIDSAAFSDHVVTDNEALLRKLLAYFLPPDATIPGGLYDAQLKGGFENFKKIIMEAAAAEKRDFTLREFLAVTKFSLTPDRIDDDVIEVMTDSMAHHDARREKLKEEIAALTAEMNIYSKISAAIAQKLAVNGTINTDGAGLDLMDPSLYGMTAEQFKNSPEYKLLSKIAGEIDPKNQALADAKRAEAAEIQKRLNEHNTNLGKLVYEAKYGVKFADDEKNRDRLLTEVRELTGGVTIKKFLESPLKRTGAMTNVENSYSYNKDTNYLSNFGTMISDRVRPLNDELSQKTTELNDISARYNSAIEALNRFIQKYESVMQSILQAF